MASSDHRSVSRRLAGGLRWAHLVPRAAGMAVRYRVVGRRKPFGEVIRADEPSGHRKRQPDPSTIARAVTMATGVWPFRATCLVRSLVAARLLKRYGYTAEVVIGVPGQDGPQDRWTAHAWVDVGRTGPGPNGYVEITRLTL